MLPHKLKIYVSKGDFENAENERSRNDFYSAPTCCPIAQALKRRGFDPFVSNSDSIRVDEDYFHGGLATRRIILVFDCQWIADYTPATITLSSGRK